MGLACLRLAMDGRTGKDVCCGVLGVWLKWTAEECRAGRRGTGGGRVQGVSCTLEMGSRVLIETANNEHARIFFVRFTLCGIYCVYLHRAKSSTIFAKHYYYQQNTHK